MTHEYNCQLSVVWMNNFEEYANTGNMLHGLTACKKLF